MNWEFWSCYFSPKSFEWSRQPPLVFAHVWVEILQVCLSLKLVLHFFWGCFSWDRRVGRFLKDCSRGPRCQQLLLRVLLYLNRCWFRLAKQRRYCLLFLKPYNYQLYKGWEERERKEIKVRSGSNWGLWCDSWGEGGVGQKGRECGYADNVCRLQ